MRSLPRWAPRAVLRFALAGAVLSAALNARSAAAEEPVRHVVVVSVEPGESGLAPDEVRAAVARELGVDVVDAPTESAVGTLTVRVDAPDTLVMTYEERETWRSVERSVELPPDPQRRLEAIALLAGNLARDEAGELVHALRAAEAERRAAEEKAEAERRAAAASATAVVLDAESPPSSARLGDRMARISGDVNGAIDAARAADTAELRREPFQAGVVPGVAIYPDGTGYRFNGVLTLLYGRQGAVDGVAGSVIAQSTLGTTRGAVGAGIWQETGLVVGAAGAGIGQIGHGPLRGAEGAGILNLRYGAVQGAQGAGIMNQAAGVVGVQGAGIFNRARGDLLGAQLAGLMNVTEGELIGAQVAGLVNVAEEPASGLMIAGLVNVARAPSPPTSRAASAPTSGPDTAPVSRVDGVRIAGLGNLGSTPLRGALFAGVFNQVGELDGAAFSGIYTFTRDLDGAEISGVANVAREVDGFQVGLTNVARDVHGFQLGLVNVARDVKGTQLGLVNVSRKVKGMPIGLINVTQDGPRVVVWHEHSLERDPQNLVGGLDVAAKFLAGPVYTQVGIGGDSVARTWDFTGGLGLHLDVQRLFFEVDALYRGDWDARASNEHDAQAVHYRGKVGFEVLPKHVGVFAGGGLRQQIHSDLTLSYAPVALLGVELR